MKGYVKPLLLTGEELAEGIYAASGAGINVSRPEIDYSGNGEATGSFELSGGSDMDSCTIVMEVNHPVDFITITPGTWEKVSGSGQKIIEVRGTGLQPGSFTFKVTYRGNDKNNKFTCLSIRLA